MAPGKVDFKDADPFFVQESPRAVWHVETPDDPERMLCGTMISVDAVASKVQKRWGTKPCLWCKRILDEHTSGEYSP
jgi:hypothetical protein